mmetsp:Transcript_64141/g.165097  ORF Transcript_64141/g.165097 Transcript_64141/m.165097 type:complete len:310 (-) Transcript_64141:1087-2016(-)
MMASAACLPSPAFFMWASISSIFRRSSEIASLARFVSAARRSRASRVLSFSASSAAHAARSWASNSARRARNFACHCASVMPFSPPSPSAPSRPPAPNDDTPVVFVPWVFVTAAGLLSLARADTSHDGGFSQRKLDVPSYRACVTPRRLSLLQVNKGVSPFMPGDCFNWTSKRSISPATAARQAGTPSDSLIIGENEPTPGLRKPLIWLRRFAMSAAPVSTEFAIFCAIRLTCSSWMTSPSALSACTVSFCASGESPSWLPLPGRAGRLPPVLPRSASRSAFRSLISCRSGLTCSIFHSFIISSTSIWL